MQMTMSTSRRLMEVADEGNSNRPVIITINNSNDFNTSTMMTKVSISLMKMMIVKVTVTRTVMKTGLKLKTQFKTWSPSSLPRPTSRKLRMI